MTVQDEDKEEKRTGKDKTEKERGKEKEKEIGMEQGKRKREE